MNFDTGDVDFILDAVEKLKREGSLLPFEDDDIRKDFYNLLYDAEYNYYRGFASFILSKSFYSGHVLFNKSLDFPNKHIERLMETSRHDISTRSQFHYLNRHLLIDAWSIFELCVTVFVKEICSEDEQNSLLTFEYNEICKNTKNSTINPSDKEKIFKTFKKQHLTHVPIVRKTNYLFKKAKHYYRDVEKDKEFLTFLGKFRNTLHTNFIYYGNNYYYKFGDAHFKFENGKILTWIDPFEPSPKLYFYLINNLKEIWDVLINAIKYPNFIPYPDLNEI